MSRRDSISGATPSPRYDTAVNTRNRAIIPSIGLIAVSLMLAACTTNIEPTQGELKAAWDSSNVTPAHYREDILAFMRAYLNDPSNVRNAGVSVPALKTVPGDPGERFVSCLRFNAKKSDGVYAGNKTAIVVYGSGKLDHVVDTPKIAHAVCDNVALAPFPELQQLVRR
jgi:hypothetical protein